MIETLLVEPSTTLLPDFTRSEVRRGKGENNVRIEGILAGSLVQY